VSAALDGISSETRPRAKQPAVIKQYGTIIFTCCDQPQYAGKNLIVTNVNITSCTAANCCDNIIIYTVSYLSLHWVALCLQNATTVSVWRKPKCG